MSETSPTTLEPSPRPSNGGAGVRVRRTVVVRRRAVPPVPPPPAKGSFGRFLAIASAIALVLVMVSFVFHQRSAAADQREASRAAAVQSARIRVPVILSYSYQSLDDDLAMSRANIAGSFQDKYAKILSSKVFPGVKAGKLTTKTTVTGAALVESETNRAVVLLFLSQSTTKGANSVPVVSSARVNATLTRTGSSWFVAGIRTL